MPQPQMDPATKIRVLEQQLQDERGNHLQIARSAATARQESERMRRETVELRAKIDILRAAMTRPGESLISVDEALNRVIQISQAKKLDGGLIGA